MAYVEILKFGTLVDSPGTTAGILSRSSGINQNLADEIVGFCKGWGKPPLGGISRPVLMSFPLNIKGNKYSLGAFAVLKVEAGAHFCIQALVINGADYASFGYNPFVLDQAGAFPAWDPKAVAGRRLVKMNPNPFIVSPPPSPEDVGLIDEALHQILASHKLYLPIEKPSGESDRCLTLLLEVIPEAMKKQLRFASFAPSPENSYHLAATSTLGCEFAGWKRLMMTLVGGTLGLNLEKYVKQVRDCLAFGDISAIRDDNQILTLGEKPQNNIQAPVAPAKRISAMPLAAVTSKPSSRLRTNKKHSILHPAARAYNSGRSDKHTPQLAHLRGGHRQLSGMAVAMLVLVLTISGGWSYLEFFNGGDGIAWKELVSLPGFVDSNVETRVTSLLEVANVGAVYNRQIKRINRAGMIPGLNPETDQRRGLVQLKKEAARPLLVQVDLFVDLASAGIKQGKRADRESERLRSLTNQGEVLAVELARLELAWHSLSLGVNWQDLGHLSDKGVLARRDSLFEKSAASLRVAAADMSFGERRKSLLYSLNQTQGMSQLLELSQATQWSEQWCKDLYRAAEAVSPAASSMTRAYRNSAFAMVRLKMAEHSPAFVANAFSDDLNKRTWPNSEVADILPGLRKQVGKFGKHDAPPLFAGTLALYHVLESPEGAVSDLVSGKIKIDDLQDNTAVQFDPGAYENHLQRLRFQAVQECSRSAGECPSLGDEADQTDILDFAGFISQTPSSEEWRAWVNRHENPFLSRWALHETKKIEQFHQAKMSGFENSWFGVWDQVQEIKTLAAKSEDWSAKWVSLDGDLNAALSVGRALVAQDASVAGQVRELSNLKAAMREPHRLELGSVTVRLDQDQLAESQKAIFEFRILPEGRILRSDPFVIGPAAPAGSGWVGTVVLARQSNLAPWAAFQGKVSLADGGQELLTVDYPSLLGGAGPGALARPKPVSGGSLSIKTGDGWWVNVQLPVKNGKSGPS